MHRPTLEQLLIALASAGEASYLAMATAEAQRSSPSSHLSSPAQGSHKTLDSPIVPGQARNVGDIMYAKYQEFWMSIGNEVLQEAVCLLILVLVVLPLLLLDVFMCVCYCPVSCPTYISYTTIHSHTHSL